MWKFQEVSTLREQLSAALTRQSDLRSRVAENAASSKVKKIFEDKRKKKLFEEINEFSSRCYLIVAIWLSPLVQKTNKKLTKIFGNRLKSTLESCAPCRSTSSFAAMCSCATDTRKKTNAQWNTPIVSSGCRLALQVSFGESVCFTLVFCFLFVCFVLFCFFFSLTHVNSVAKHIAELDHPK